MSNSVIRLVNLETVKYLSISNMNLKRISLQFSNITHIELINTHYARCLPRMVTHCHVYEHSPMRKLYLLHDLEYIKTNLQSLPGTLNPNLKYVDSPFKIKAQDLIVQVQSVIYTDEVIDFEDEIFKIHEKIYNCLLITFPNVISSVILDYVCDNKVK